MGDLSISNVDLSIVVLYMVATVILGLWIGGHPNSIRSYFLANKSLPWWALLFSIVATETSTVTFLSVPGIAYDSQDGDFRFLQAAIGFVVGRIVVAFWILPGFFRSSYLTSYQLLSDKFGTSIQKLASLLFMVTRTLADALRLYLTAIVLREIIQLDLWICITFIGVATIIYTFVGGMKSVVWNDCIQFVVYMLGAIAALFILLNLIPGGWQEVMEFGNQNDKFRTFDLNPDPRSVTFTFWIGVLGGAFLSMATHGTDQLTVQRLLSANSETSAAMVVVSSGIVVFLQFTLFLLIGVALACFYQTSANPPAFTSNDQVFATFIVDQLPIGLVGLILAAVFSAAMSTLSSSLNASSSAFVNDFLANEKSAERHHDQKRLMTFARFGTMIFGGAQIIIAIFAEKLIGDRSAVYKVLTIAGFASGPILGLFLLVAADKKFSQFAAIIGFVGSLIVLSCAAFGLPDEYKINGFYYCLLGSISTCCIAWLCDLFFNSSDVQN